MTRDHPDDHDQALDLVAYSQRVGGAVTVVAALAVALVASYVGRALIVSSEVAVERQKVELLRELAPLPDRRVAGRSTTAALQAVLTNWCLRAGWSGMILVGSQAEGPLWIGPAASGIPARLRAGIDWFNGPELVTVPAERAAGSMHYLTFRADLAPDLSRPEYLLAFRSADDLDRRLQSLQLVIFAVISGTLGLLFSALISVVRRGEKLRRAALARAEALRRSSEEAHALLVQAAKMTALGELAAGVAHEINNPVAVVRNAVEILAARPAGAEPDVRQALSDIGEAAERIRRIVKDLSGFAAPQAGELGPVELARLLARTAELARLSMPASEAGQVQLVVPSDLPLVRGQEGPLQQVFLNLIMNARYAVARRESGPGPAPEPRVHVEARVAQRALSHAVEVTVSDNGPGIAPENVERIFEPFFTTKPRAEGCGLGLWISRRIVEGHGGRIRVASESGEGARFTVELQMVGPDA